MIPENISRNHVLKALADIDANGIPKRRISAVYDLWYEGKGYSPKYVVSVANQFANAMELPSSAFNGGTETNTFLASRGFQIVTRTQTSPTGNPKKHDVHSSKTHHNSHCAKCKDVVIQSLKHLYGEVISTYNANVSSKLTAYEDSPYYPQLAKIYQGLQQFRGHQVFVKQDNLSPCDIYLPNPGFVLEF
ncbi:hypothetical protein [Alicyclobacillus sp. SO9]|uniref:hypothetical protein n=1 Tax=Alicyclobacillus sp. SO9 TaxID=2665646 RepID=UPI0018E8C5AA|nr:hypothetical protein [Alicyclobacillus sp. SO9]QQE80490.1 hypothetical protein GI364_08805 [Alicyclobacillus sp. SO9]